MRCLSLLGLLFSVGCSSPVDIEVPFNFQIAVVDDREIPLSDVEIWGQELLLGTTSNKGDADIHLNGGLGEEVILKVHCPDGMMDAERKVRLQRLESHGNRGFDMQIQCDRIEREMALLVSTNHSGVNVMIDGVQQGKTNAQGVAHFVMNSTPGTLHDLSLQVPERSKLSPAQPLHSITVLNHDAMYIVEQEFTKPRRRRRTIQKTEMSKRPEPMGQHF